MPTLPKPFLPASVAPAGIGRRLGVLARAFAGALTLSLMWVAAPLQTQAQVLQPSTAWAALSAPQKEFLAPLQPSWATIDAARQRKWIDVAAKSTVLSPEERSRVQERMAGWAQMSPEDRGRARLNYQELKQLTAKDERQTQWEAYQALPEARKRELSRQGLVERPAEPVRRVARANRSDNVKSAIVKSGPPSQRSLRTVGPTVVQATPGATTSLMSQPATPPLHQQAGLPKLSAKPGFVDPKTLLPRRGLQGAAVASKPDGLAKQP